MGKYDKLRFKLLNGLSDADFELDDLCLLLKYLSFEARISGSHHVFRKSGVAEKVNLQRQGSKAKPYQVKQVRTIVQKYRLVKEE